MGVTSDAHSWWEESQMRFLVLSSLALQFLLSLVPLLRRYAMPGWLRSVMWLAFLGGDALAIFALATLFDRHKADQGRGGSSTLEVVWAPILLAHLGGLHGVSAWNIEDNDKWGAYLLTAGYQIGLAIYVFCKSWPQGGDKKLLRAAILLFVYGGLKCLERAEAAERASFTSVVRAQASQRRARQSDGQMVVVEYVEAVREFVQCQADDDEGEMQEASTGRAPVEGQGPPNLHGEAYNLILGNSSPYDSRLRKLRWFWGLSGARAHDCVKEELAVAFLLFYTRLKRISAGISPLEPELSNWYGLVKSMFGQWIRRWEEVLTNPSYKSLLLLLASPSRVVLPWAAIGLFHQSHREAYNDIDVKVTYAIVCCTAVLQFYSTFGVPFILLINGANHEVRVTTALWPDTIAQCSLIGYFFRDKKHSILMRLASLLGCKGLLDQLWGMNPCKSACSTTKLILAYLKAGWKLKIHDAASYHSFNDSRGHWALAGIDNLHWSINCHLDESVLLWHIATDICFFLSPVLSQDENNQTSQWIEQRVISRQISNYMVYLLFFNNLEMVSPDTNISTRKNLFRTAYNDLNDIFLYNDEKKNPVNLSRCTEEALMKILISSIKSSCTYPALEGKGSLVLDAWDLAQTLLNLDYMWDVIHGVWVEMLCFSANRCSGYLHVKALGSGGEFLSYVWLMSTYMGMETFTDRLQRQVITSEVINDEY